MIKVFIILWGMFIESFYGYFDGGINYTTGRDGYTQQDIYLLFGKNDWWIRPEFSTYKTQDMERVDRFSSRVGFERKTYGFAFEGGLTPQRNDYGNFTGGLDLTFSLSPTSSLKRRLAGPNSGFVSRSGKGVTRIDLGCGAKITHHKYTSYQSDLMEYQGFVFAGAKFFLTQISINYSFYNYNKDDLAKTEMPQNNRVFGMNSYLRSFLKSNLNFKVEMPGSPLVTPYISYNRIKTTSNDPLNIYAFGFYLDLSMLGITTHFETYKDTRDKTQRYLSISGGIRF